MSNVRYSLNREFPHFCPISLLPDRSHLGYESSRISLGPLEIVQLIETVISAVNTLWQQGLTGSQHSITIPISNRMKAYATIMYAWVFSCTRKPKGRKAANFRHIQSPIPYHLIMRLSISMGVYPPQVPAGLSKNNVPRRLSPSARPLVSPSRLHRYISF